MAMLRNDTLRLRLFGVLSIAFTPMVMKAQPAPTQDVTVPYNTTIAARLLETVDSDLSREGDTFVASLASPVKINGTVVIPEEASLQGKVVEIRNAGRFNGRSGLVISLTGLAYNGQTYQLRTNQYSREGPSRDIQSAAVIGGGASIGALIGGILGGGKGAAIGAVIGGGTGAGVQARRKAAPVQLSAESILVFRLQTPLTITPSSTLRAVQNNAPDSSRDPFPGDRPVLKRRPGSTPPAGTAPETTPQLPPGA
jgi:hypothetical protein